MRSRRVLAIGLDGLEVSLAERWMDAGELPALAALRARSARALLDHGRAQRTGLAWEHVATGLGPEESGRDGAVEFDPATYEVWQEGAQRAPCLDALGANAVVFDPPYFDLERAPRVRGVVAWGAHDPGIEPAARPAELLAELAERVGDYPAPEWIYGTPWPSEADCRRMGEGLVRALDARTRAACWLVGERLPDWELALAVAGEVHSAIEGLWHGVDARHPLHEHASAPAAADALMGVHRALDRFVGALVEAAGDATVVAFAMGGMGENRSDVPSMVLLPELLHRHAFGRSLLCVPAEWSGAAGGLPMLAKGERWTEALQRCMPPAPRSWASRLRRLARGPAEVATRTRAVAPGRAVRSLAWQPAARYQALWPRMQAFALPSFYDGRVRVNLDGREAAGTVALAYYADVCGEIEDLLRDCRDPRTGRPVVERIERPYTRDPLALGRSEADLCVVWCGTPLALAHPRLGTVGPVPFRRTGGHTGRHGVAYLAGPDLEPVELGVRRALDVVPTLAHLLGAAPAAPVAGASLLAREDGDKALPSS